MSAMGVAGLITGPSAIGSPYGMPTSHKWQPRQLLQHGGGECQIGITGCDERHCAALRLSRRASRKFVNRGHENLLQSGDFGGVFAAAPEREGDVADL